MQYRSLAGNWLINEHGREYQVDGHEILRIHWPRVKCPGAFEKEAKRSVKQTKKTMIANSVSKKCSINVTQHNNRLKTYGDKVFLKDGQSFEIELFNPHTFSVLFKIKLNGKYISSSGLILRPGQRIYLERYLDENRKFLFETYDVENTPEAKSAIAENGKVSVEVYYEKTKPQTMPFYGTTIINGWRDTYTTSGNSSDLKYSSNSSDMKNIIGDVSCFFNSNDCEPELYRSFSKLSPQSIETGMIGKGEVSSQSFTTVDEDFNTWASETANYQILPESQRPQEIADLREYCTTCGARKKKQQWKFCPSCGTRYDA